VTTSESGDDEPRGPRWRPNLEDPRPTPSVPRRADAVIPLVGDLQWLGTSELHREIGAPLAHRPDRTVRAEENAESSTCGPAREPGRMDLVVHDHEHATTPSGGPRHRLGPRRAGWPARRPGAQWIAHGTGGRRPARRAPTTDRARTKSPRACRCLGSRQRQRSPAPPGWSAGRTTRRCRRTRGHPMASSRALASTTATSASSERADQVGGLEPGRRPHRWRASRAMSPRAPPPPPRQLNARYPHVVASVGRFRAEARGSRPTRRRGWPSRGESSPQSTVAATISAGPMHGRP